MAEERSTIRTSPSPATASTSDDPQEIRESIERTRDDMGRTINELQERLSPQHVVQQAKDSLHDATVGRVKDMVASAADATEQMAERAQDTAKSVVDEVRAHPVASALIGAGVVWLIGGTSLFRRHDTNGDGDDDSYAAAYRPGSASTNWDNSSRTAHFQGAHDMRNGQSWTDVFRSHPMPTALAAASLGYLLMHRDSGTRPSSSWRERSDASRGYDGPGVVRARNGGESGVRGGSRDTLDEARDTASDLGDKVREWGEDVTDRARDAGAQARDTAQELTGQVQEQWQSVRRRTASEFDEWMDENPLAVGAAALAAGLAIGFSVPRTRVENQTMGATRDALVERTTDAAEDAAGEVKDRVLAAAETLVSEEEVPMGAKPSSETPSSPRPIGI